MSNFSIMSQYNNLWLTKTIWVIYRMPTAEASTWIFGEIFCYVLSRIMKSVLYKSVKLGVALISDGVGSLESDQNRRLTKSDQKTHGKSYLTLIDVFIKIPLPRHFTKILTDPFNLKASRCFSLRMFFRLWKNSL